MTRIAHIINPVKVNQNSDLFFAQPISFESMLVAQKNAINTVSVELFTTQFEEDIEIIPNGFNVLENLSRSVLDVNPKLKKRKLPLIIDILQALKKGSDAEYFIYTNADIGLISNFYLEVNKYIKNGADAVIINRRRLKARYQNISDLSEIYKDKGKSHPGFDCFVFKRELLEKFVLDNICVGIPFLGVSLAYNIFSFAEKPKYVFSKHLTFHIGEEVLPIRNNDFYEHNFHCFFKEIKPRLIPYFRLSNFPFSDKTFLIRLFKFALNPSLQTRDLLKMKFPKVFKSKIEKNRYQTKTRFLNIRNLINEIRWWFLER